MNCVLGPIQRRTLPPLPTQRHLITRVKISSPMSTDEKATSSLATLETKLVPRIDKIPSTTIKSITSATTRSTFTIVDSEGKFSMLVRYSASFDIKILPNILSGIISMSTI